ncbi:MAG: carbohydrate ABC transporter permease [Spirochaetaceae bacterium]|nr:carbohydrate ABC transporter permease [Spirochaetaceae bacterium]
MSDTQMASIKRKKKSSSIGKESFRTKIVIGSFIALVLIVYVYPILNLVNVSFKTSPEFMLDPIGLTNSIHFNNYIKVFVQGNFLRNFYNSLYYLFASNLLVLSITSLAAFVISRRYIRFAGFFYVLFLAGLFLPEPLIPQFILMNKLGLYNNPIGYILTRTNPGIVMLLMVGYYRTLPKTFDEAAVLDGCGVMRYLAFFILPMSKPVFASAAILFSVGVWNDIIGTTVFLTSPRYYPVIRALFAFVGQYGTDWPPLAAAVFIVATPLIIIFLFFQKYIISGMVSGGVKG